MKRATITIPDELEVELDAYLASQDAAPSLAAVVQAALRRYLREKRLELRQYIPPQSPLSITPAAAGSGKSDVSIRHDLELDESG
ncbi:MAG: hypothetical protein V3T72_11830 [Thermoanaerobaculia bacterium]